MMDDSSAGKSDGAFILEKRLGLADWLTQPLRENRWLYVRVIVAAALINIFVLFTSLYTMTVYDRVIPTGSHGSLIGLTIGMVIFQRRRPHPAPSISAAS